MKFLYGNLFDTCGVLTVSMALLRYFKKRDGLPDPKGSLSHTIPSRAISMANSEVTEATTGDKKRGPYKKYSPEERCRMGRYADQMCR